MDSVGIKPLHIDPNYSWLVNEQIEGIGVRYKLNREKVEVGGDFRSLIKIHKIEPLAAIVRKLAPQDYIATLDKGALEGKLAFEKEYFSISSSTYQSPFAYHVKFKPKKGESKIDVVLSFPLEWEKKLELYPELKKVTLVESGSYHLKCSLRYENGRVLDDLDARIFEQDPHNGSLESLEKQLENLTR